MAAASLIDLVEACYRTELGDEAWVRGLADAARPVIGTEIGAAAFTYRVLPEGTLAANDLAVTFAKHLDPSFLRTLLQSMPATFVHDWMERPTGFLGGDARFAAFKHALPAGLQDVLAIHGRDTSGHGVWVGAPLRVKGRWTRSRQATLARVAAHAAAGYRVRRALAGQARVASEAVLSPGGRVEHAEGPAREARAREALRRATVQLDRARSAKGRADAERSIDEWRAMVMARWSLVDRFESDGRHFIVATTNVPAAPTIDVLTERERQVVAFAVLGHHDKLIAYELGIAPSTVRVLIFRAMGKLKLRTRAELIATARQG